MSAPLECLICNQPHGAGPQPWGRVPAWIRICDECLPDGLTARDRVLMGLARMPFNADGARQVAACGHVAESTARKHLPELVTDGLAHGPLVHGWWTATHEGITRAINLTLPSTPKGTYEQQQLAA